MEREIKLKVDDFEAVREILEEWWFVREERQTILYFDTPDRRLRQQNKWLRARFCVLVPRSEADIAQHFASSKDRRPQVELTVKDIMPVSNDGGVAARNEDNLNLSRGSADLQTVVSFLRSLGYEEILRYEKGREIFAVRPPEGKPSFLREDPIYVPQTGDAIVCLDNIEGLGKYIEIEGDSTEVILETQELLGLKDVKTISSSYPAMILEKL